MATIMLLTSIPVLGQNVPTGAYVPPDTGQPPIIKAKWEEPDSADPSHLTLGTQVLPPMRWGSTVPVEYCVVVTDINGKDNVNSAYVDVYHPDGSFKYQLPLDEVNTTTPTEKQSALDEYCLSVYDYQKSHEEQYIHVVVQNPGEQCTVIIRDSEGNIRVHEAK